MSRLILDNISKRYQDVTALQPTGLTVEEGTFLTLLGPSGCGKTTLLRIVGGFIAPDQGRVHIDDQDVTHAPPRLRNVGMVFQDYALFPHLSVAENIAFGLRERRTPRAQLNDRVDELLNLVRLQEMADRFPAQLSGGQQQRVALARALAHPPRVLLMDEPFSALDARLREGLRMELRQLQQRLGITTLFITHDRQEAMALSDVICVMQSGRIEQRGTARDLYLHPCNHFVADFIGPLNTLRTSPDHLPTIAADSLIGVRPEHIRLHGAADDATSPPAHWPRLRGQVISTTYHGSEIHVAVDIGNTVWNIHAPASSPAPPTDVSLSWAPEHTFHF